MLEHGSKAGRCWSTDARVGVVAREGKLEENCAVFEWPATRTRLAAAVHTHTLLRHPSGSASASHRGAAARLLN